MKIEVNFQECNINSLHTFVNPYSWLILRKFDPVKLSEFRVYADGILFVILYNLFARRKIVRVSFDFTSIAHHILNLASNQNKSLFLIGGVDGISTSAGLILNAMYSNKLKLIGSRSGIFEDNDDYNRALNESSKADIVIAGMGAPLQEAFLFDLKQRGWEGIGFTCGGFFDQVVAGGGAYYPALINTFNLRWLYRLYKEPKRLWKRYLLDYPKFIVLFIYDIVKNK